MTGYVVQFFLSGPTTDQQARIKVEMTLRKPAEGQHR